MSVFPLIRGVSYPTRDSKGFYCFICRDYESGDNDSNEVSKFVRLGCRCISHYHCLIQYIRSKLGNRLKISLNGISCPYGKECKSYKTLDDVGGDETKLYYITTTDLDIVVDYGRNNPKLKENLDENDCEELTHEEVNDLRKWLEEKREIKIFTDDDFDLFVISTTKACPSCGFRSTHFQGHQCHHVECPNCNINYCYKCLSSEIENIRDRGEDYACKCGCWTNFCHSIKSPSDIEKYISINEGGIPFDIRCGCIICNDCREDMMCIYCPGDCCVCLGYVNPSPNEVIDASSEQHKWRAEGPSLFNRRSWSEGSSGSIESIYSEDNFAFDREGRIYNNEDNFDIRDLMDYCRQGNSYMLRRVLQSGDMTPELINRQDGHGRTALFLAVDARHSECVALLLDFDDIDVNISDRSKKTPLILAVENSLTDIVNILLSHDGIDLNTVDEYDKTALHYASEKNNTEIVNLLLLQEDIDIDSKDCLCRTPLMKSCENGNSEMVRLLLQRSEQHQCAPNSCASIDVNVILRIDGSTPLHFCATYGLTDIVKLLLQHVNINVNAKKSNGSTPLYIACCNDEIEIARMILSHPGFSFDSQSVRDCVMHGQVGALERLLASGDVTIDQLNLRDDEDGRTALRLSCAAGFTECVGLLLTVKGIDVNTSDVDRNTPLHVACRNYRTEVVSLLLQHASTNISIVNKQCETALSIANSNKFDDIIKLFEDKRRRDGKITIKEKKNGLYSMDDD